ncbi:MAG: enoyl-CoA hydratase/isomerase family protein [Cuniculiplasma sp.]
MSKAPRVAGFKEISFWQEDGIGVITILSDDAGKVTLLFFEEFLKAISLAMADDKVKSVAITGSNDNFLSGVRNFGKNQNMQFLDMVNTVASFVAMLNKPVFSLVNGKCSDLGVELSLLTDISIAREGSIFSISNNYLPTMGLSRTISKYPYFLNGKAKEGLNCDIVFSQDKFLDQANDYMLDNFQAYLPMARRQRFGEINLILANERATYLSQLINMREIQ